jgi:hypothetical protein
VTPTFAAGLGVVVAAVLAYQVGTPSFRVNMPRWNGQRCANAGCAAVPGGGAPASVKRGKRISVPTSPAAGGTPSPRPARAGTRPAASQPVVTYQTINSWPGGFLGYLTVTFTRGHAPAHWWLRFSYPHGRIQRVWGPVRWEPKSEHTGVVSGTRVSGQVAAWPGIEFWFEAAGHAGKPDRCVFSGVACRVR